MLAACAGRSGALGEAVLGALQLVYVPFEFVYVALDHAHALHALGELAAVLGKKLGPSLVAALVLSFEPDDPGDLIQGESEGLELHYALEVDKVLVGVKALVASGPALGEQTELTIISYGPERQP